MSQLKLQKKSAKVVSYNKTTGDGRVTVGRKRYQFEVTSFRGNRSSRYPESGQTVEAILSEDGKRLVSVWANEDKSAK
jgi:hypothetical protein